MMSKKTFQKMREKQKELSELPLNNFGRYSLWYRGVASYFKVAPWKIGFIFAMATSIFLIYFFGSSFVRLASLIGRGF